MQRPGHRADNCKMATLFMDKEQNVSPLKACMYFFIECSLAQVVASKPCRGIDASITEEQCRQLSQECCVFKKSRGDSNCFKIKQPNAGNHGDMTYVFNEEKLQKIF